MVLQATFPHPAGFDLPVRATAIDTGGHHTKMAYEFCRTRLARRIWAIKGRGGPGIPVWPRRPTRTNKGKIPLFIVGVDAVKDAVYARLRLTEPGPGAIHFPRRLDADYFRQLTAERVVTRFERGRPIRSWQPKRDGERNEERRGKREDDELELAFRRIRDGANYVGEMPGFEIIFADKKTNSAGLQLADLTARPIGRHVLDPAQPNRAWEIIEPKLRRSPAGVVRGWGLKVFP
jgi:hypothetical protein